MPSTRVFPDGVGLARHWELPGPEQNRASNWARIQAANITTGFIDEYPRTTMRLRDERVAFHDYDQLIEHFEKQLEALVRATKDA